MATVAGAAIGAAAGAFAGAAAAGVAAGASVEAALARVEAAAIQVGPPAGSGVAIDDDRFLAEQNRLPMDEDIQFREEGHLYSARSPYASDPDVWLSKVEGDTSLPLVSTTELIKQNFEPTNFERISFRVFASFVRNGRTDPRYAGCESPADIRRVWSSGATLGTLMHRRFEVLANLLERERAGAGAGLVDAYLAHLRADPEELPFPEYAHFGVFCKHFGLDTGRRVFFRTEYCMFHPELNLCGMIDGILYDRERDGYIIIDYKRCRGGLRKGPANPRVPVRSLSSGSRGISSEVFMNLRNVDAVRYGIQLTVYKNFFERMHPGRRVLEMHLVVVDSRKLGAAAGDPRNAIEFFKIGLRQYQHAVDDLFDRRARDIYNRCRENLAEEHILALADYAIVPEDDDEDERPETEFEPEPEPEPELEPGGRDRTRRRLV